MQSNQSNLGPCVYAIDMRVYSKASVIRRKRALNWEFAGTLISSGSKANVSAVPCLVPVTIKSNDFHDGSLCGTDNSSGAERRGCGAHIVEKWKRRNGN